MQKKNDFENPSTIFEIVDLKSGWCNLQQEKQRAYPHTQLVSATSTLLFKHLLYKYIKFKIP